MTQKDVHEPLMSSAINKYLFFSFFKLINYFWLRWVFIAAHRLFSSCGEWGLFFLVVHGLLTAVASPVAEYGL